jgi:hypothetical protein
LLDTIPPVDPQLPDYAPIRLPRVESFLANPGIILHKRLERQ